MEDKMVLSAYPKLIEAKSSYAQAYKNLKDSMADTFPRGAKVKVRHHRGEYTGTVVRTDEYRVYVINDKSGKISHQYPCYDVAGCLAVEIISE